VPLPNVRLTTECANALPNLLQIETAMWRFHIDPNMTCVNMSFVQLINLCVIHITCHVNLLPGVIVLYFHVISGGSHFHVSDAHCTATCHPVTWVSLLRQNTSERDILVIRTPFDEPKSVPESARQALRNGRVFKLF